MGVVLWFVRVHTIVQSIHTKKSVSPCKVTVIRKHYALQYVWICACFIHFVGAICI